jgi:hypothetical protein
MDVSLKSPLLGIVKYDVCSTAYYPLLTSRCKGAHYVWSSSLRLQARIRAAETALDNWDLSRPSVLAVPPRFTFQSPTTPFVPGPYPSVMGRGELDVRHKTDEIYLIIMGFLLIMVLMLFEFRVIGYGYKILLS